MESPQLRDARFSVLRFSNMINFTRVFCCMEMKLMQGDPSLLFPQPLVGPSFNASGHRVLCRHFSISGECYVGGFSWFSAVVRPVRSIPRLFFLFETTPLYFFFFLFRSHACFPSGASVPQRENRSVLCRVPVCRPLPWMVIFPYSLPVPV